MLKAFQRKFLSQNKSLQYTTIAPCIFMPLAPAWYLQAFILFVLQKHSRIKLKSCFVSLPIFFPTEQCYFAVFHIFWILDVIQVLKV